MIGASDDGSLGLAGHPQALLHRLIGAIGVKREDVTPLGSPSPTACGPLRLPERSASSRGIDRSLARTGVDACRRSPSPPRFKASRSSSPTTRTKRAWRWRSPCAKRWRRRARPRRSSRPTRRSRAASRPSLRDGASRSKIRPGARWGKARPARWPGSSSKPRSSSRRARFLRSSRIPRSASAARASNSKPRRARSSLRFFALSRLPRWTISNGRSRRRVRPPKTGMRIRRSAASARPTVRRRRRSRATLQSRSLPCARFGPTHPCATASLSIGSRSSATVAGAQGAVEDAHGFEQLTELMDEWSEAAVESFPTGAQRIRRFVRRCAGRGARSAGERRPPAPHDPRPARSASLELRSRASGGPRRDGLAARGRDRRLSQPADARRARPFGAGAAHRSDGA